MQVRTHQRNCQISTQMLLTFQAQAHQWRTIEVLLKLHRRQVNHQVLLFDRIQNGIGSHLNGLRQEHNIE